jgi:multidrug resistance efflux pump
MANLSSENRLPRVPVARSVRLRHLRVFAIPVLSFLLAVVAWGYLWDRQSGQLVLVGQVDSFRINVNSPTSGLITRMPHPTRLQWSLFDPIEAGDVIAEFDDTEYRNHLARFEFQIDQAKKNLVAWQSAASEVLLSAEGAKTSLDEVVQYEIGLLDNARFAVEGDLVDSAADGEEEDPIPTPDSSIDATLLAQLDRLRTSREELLLRVDELRLMRDNLQIRAPISGTLVDFFCAPGQRLALGGPVATIAAAQGRNVIAYLPESAPQKPEVGMLVALRSRSPGATLVSSTIEEVASQLSPIPTRQSGNPAIVQWGIPVRITMPTEVEFRAGSLVDVLVYGAVDPAE